MNPPVAELIGLVTGGRSGERDRSLLSAEAVGEALDRQGLKFVRLDPSERDFADRIRDVDVAFLAIAGQWAEDGKLQGLLDSVGVLYTGSGVLASATAMHKPTAKALVAAAGVRVLPHALIREGDDLAEVARASGTLGMPVILKPCSEGGSIGVQVIRDPGRLPKVVAEYARHGGVADRAVHRGQRHHLRGAPARRRTDHAAALADRAYNCGVL